jgi:hypothetical protein
VLPRRERQIRKAYREEQEDQLVALGLVVNAVALWNSKYLSPAVDQLRAQRVPIKGENAARLSPLGHAHLNCLGGYAIASSAPTAGLRQLARSDLRTLSPRHQNLFERFSYASDQSPRLPVGQHASGAENQCDGPLD